MKFDPPKLLSDTFQPHSPKESSATQEFMLHNPNLVASGVQIPQFKKLKLSKDEVRKYDQQNERFKNSLGLIQRKEKLFCCFTSKEVKMMRFYKRLIVLQEATILCHLSSPYSTSFLYNV